MNKKLGIIATVVTITLIYLLLLVALPVLENIVPLCGSGNTSETVNMSAIEAIEAITANWSAIGPALRDKPFREIYKAPLLLYFVPGLVGMAVIVVILNQKKEVK